MGDNEVIAEWVSQLVEYAQRGVLAESLDDLALAASGDLASSIEAELWAMASIQFRLQVGAPVDGVSSAEISQWLYVMALGRAGGHLSFEEWHGIVAAAMNDFTAEAPIMQMRRIQLLAVLVSLLEVRERRVPFALDIVNAELERLDRVAAQAQHRLGREGGFKWRKKKR